MAFLIWEQRLSVANEEIDSDHRKQMQLINELHDGMVEQAGQMALETKLNDLINFTRVHFAAEEKLMHDCGFPGLPHHKAAHSRLIRRLREYQHRLQVGDQHAAADVLCLLQSWLIEHILTEDMEIGRMISATTS